MRPNLTWRVSAPAAAAAGASEQPEVVSLPGNVALMDGKPKIHAYCVVGNRRERTYRGHLKTCTVRPLLEVFLTAIDGELERVKDEEAGTEVLRL